LPKEKVGFKIFKNMESVNIASTNYNQHIMQEVGRIIANNPQTIIDLLESNDFIVDPSISAIELGDAYLYELPNNDGLKLGTAYLVSTQNSSFSGEIDNEEIYDSFDAISDYWTDENEDEETSNWVGAVAQGVGAVSNLGTTALQGAQKRKYGTLDLAQKQVESRQALISGIIAQKQAQSQIEQKKIEEQSKKNRTTIIAVASVLGVLVLIGGYVLLKNRRNG
jgi:hypothetical protein